MFCEQGDGSFMSCESHQADQSGTIVEVVAQDGKPVAIESVSCSSAHRLHRIFLAAYSGLIYFLLHLSAPIHH